MTKLFTMQSMCPFPILFSIWHYCREFPPSLQLSLYRVSIYLITSIKDCLGFFSGRRRLIDLDIRKDFSSFPSLYSCFSLFPCWTHLLTSLIIFYSVPPDHYCRCAPTAVISSGQ